MFSYNSESKVTFEGTNAGFRGKARTFRAAGGCAPPAQLPSAGPSARLSINGCATSTTQRPHYAR
eukprot:2866085-Pyramimonas_sp.AAC.1